MRRRAPSLESAALVVIVLGGLGAGGVIAHDRYLSGYRTTELQPVAVVRADRASTPDRLQVVVSWPHDGICPGELQATAVERPDRVVVAVVDREPRGGGACGGVGTNGVTAGVPVVLTGPLGGRPVYARGQAAPLPVSSG